MASPIETIGSNPNLAPAELATLAEANAEQEKYLQGLKQPELELLKQQVAAHVTRMKDKTVVAKEAAEKLLAENAGLKLLSLQQKIDAAIRKEMPGVAGKTLGTLGSVYGGIGSGVADVAEGIYDLNKSTYDKTSAYLPKTMVGRNFGTIPVIGGAIAASYFAASKLWNKLFGKAEAFETNTDGSIKAHPNGSPKRKSMFGRRILNLFGAGALVTAFSGFLYGGRKVSDAIDGKKEEKPAGAPASTPPSAPAKTPDMATLDRFTIVGKELAIDGKPLVLKGKKFLNTEKTKVSEALPRVKGITKNVDGSLELKLIYLFGDTITLSAAEVQKMCKENTFTKNLSDTVEVVFEKK